MPCSPRPSGSPARCTSPDPGARVQLAVAPCSPFSVTTRLMDGVGRRSHAGSDCRCTRTSPRPSRRRRTAASSTAARPSSTSTSSAGWPTTSGARIASISPSATSSDFAAPGRASRTARPRISALGAGVAPVRQLVDAGVRVGLGVDGSASNERGDLFLEVKQALLVARGRGGPTALTARDALRLGDARRSAPCSAATTSARSSRASTPTSRSGAPTGSSSAAPTTRSPASCFSAPSPRRPAGRRRRGRRARRCARPRRRGRDRACPSGPGAKIRSVSASLSTHVLDTAAGRPAAGVRVELRRGDDEVARPRPTPTGVPRLADGLEPGTYTLVFHPPSPFFTRVEVRGRARRTGHHHVPLLVSPYGCATYRGS